MRKAIYLLLFALMAKGSFAQSKTITGEVTNKYNGAPLAECLIELNLDLDGARLLINQISNRAKNTPYVKSFSNPAVNAANYQIAFFPPFFSKTFYK